MKRVWKDSLDPEGVKLEGYRFITPGRFAASQYDPQPENLQSLGAGYGRFRGKSKLASTHRGGKNTFLPSD
ncbi:hypothetical protein MHH57_15820 [Paenibacillus sp. FSL H7-0442]|uniref:hypothetical protein n=1 Tax=Paenibacillus sp. FSL H7-0442 TaxID=2921435 RepID=UPI003159913A